MKITDFCLVFMILFICIAVRLDSKAASMQAVSSKKMQYDLSLEAAVDDAVNSLVEVDSRRNLALNKDKCVENFFHSLYVNFNVMEDNRLQEQLKVYVPIILVTDQDGYYIYYSALHEQNGALVVTRQWTAKQPYAYEDKDFLYSFTLDDYVRIYEKSKKQVREGRFQDLVAVFPKKGLFSNYSLFEETRRKTIVNTIIGDMTYYMNRHNRIGEHYGVQYTFALPFIQQEDWYRTIDDISLFVVFQGYPYGAGTSDVYNRYAFAGARIKKSNCFYITKNEGKKFYHKSECNQVEEDSDPYFSKKECALEGAYPCMDCNP